MSEKLLAGNEKLNRIQTYIAGFDEQIEGGIPEGHITLIAGTSGTMKSSLSFSIMYNEVLHNKKVGIYVSLEQSYQSILNHMILLGMDLSLINLVVISDISELEEKIEEIKASSVGTLIMTDLGAIRKEIKEIKKFSANKDWLNVIQNIVKKIKEKTKLELFVMDSLSALYALSDFEEPRNRLFYIFETLRDLNITTFLISEMPLDNSRYGEYGVEDYLSDAIIFLEMKRKDRKVVREISVVKMRSTNCNMNVFVLVYDPKHGFKALSKMNY